MRLLKPRKKNWKKIKKLKRLLKIILLLAIASLLVGCVHKEENSSNNCICFNMNDEGFENLSEENIRILKNHQEICGCPSV